MPEVILVRHGQSANNALPESERVCDPGLTTVGVQQAEKAADHFAQHEVSHLYCSPFLRSLETMRPIAAAAGVRPSIRPDIFEQGGCYSGYPAIGLQPEPGMGANKLAQRYPGWQIDPSIRDEGWWLGEYESLSEATARAQRVAAWITQELTTAGVHLLVIHADFKALLLKALQPALPNYGPLYNTGVSRLGWNGTAWHEIEINAVSHLPSQLQTY